MSVIRLRYVLLSSVLLVAAGCERSDCECVPASEPGTLGTPPPAPDCGERLCPRIVARGGGDSDFPFESDSAEALTCALTALRDRTPGVLEYAWDHDYGQYTSDGYVLIQADGTAVFRWWGQADLDYDVGPAELHELRSAATYEDCLGDDDLEAQLGCVLARGPSISTCDPGWSAFYE